MLIGEYQHTIDAKGRMIVPAKFREDLGFTFIVTRGLDGCLYGYPLEQWELIQNKLRDLPQSKKDARAFTRFMNSAAIEVEFDKQGRVNISQTLREYAGLEKNCRIRRTLAACLIHASRTLKEELASPDELRTGAYVQFPL